MPKLRIALIVSLVILVVLLVFTVFRPMTSGEKFSEVSRESTIQTEDEWIIQFDLINKEGKDTNYIINWSSGVKSYTEKALVGDGRIYRHIYHVYPETVKDGKVNLTIYKEGESTPFEKATYYIRFEQE